MAFKMAERSLFAVLLRSPWWYSALAACASIAISMVVARGQYLIFGVAVAIPFLVIATIAAFRQFQRPSKKRVLEVEEQARQMRPRAIADKIAESYVNERYRAIPSNSKAADLQLTRGSHTILVSCKRFKAATTGIEPLKQLVAAGQNVDATDYLLVAFGDISASAGDFANKNRIEIIQAESLAKFFDGQVKIA